MTVWDHTWLTVGWGRWEQDISLKTEGFWGLAVFEVFLSSAHPFSVGNEQVGL